MFEIEEARRVCKDPYKYNSGSITPLPALSVICIFFSRFMTTVLMPGLLRQNMEDLALENR